MQPSAMDVTRWCVVSPAVCCVVGIFLLMYIYGIWRLRLLSSAGIPGPAPTIFLGNFTHFATKGLVDPSRRLRKRYGKVYGQYVGAQPFIIVHDMDILKEVLVKKFDNFTNRKTVISSIDVNQLAFGAALNFSRDAQWYRLRRIMTAAFSGSKIRHMCGQLNAVAAVLAANLGAAAEEQEPCCVREYFVPYVLDTIANTTLGVQINTQKDFNHPLVINMTQIFARGFRKWKLLFLSVAFPVIKPMLKICGVHTFETSALYFLRTFVKSIINKRQKQPESQKHVDLLHILIDANENNVHEGTPPLRSCNHVSFDEVHAQGMLFLATFDGLSVPLSFLAHALATHPDVQKALFDEIHSVVGDQEEPTWDNVRNMEYLDHVIRETLRLYPPLTFIGRETANTVTIKGYTFPKGSTVIIPSLEIQRDPDYYDEPDTFLPDRWKGNINPLAWLPFGYGQRQCLAVRLAMLTMKIAIIHVLRKVKFVTLPGTPDLLELEYPTIGRIVPKQAIKLRIELRDRA
ncbi:cytochrome P450 3A4-like [Haliotis asinina]|uniref:cytochrome P450 3A4-like n=1 Tax=Haliotis asinina TaxID=109174 RepID=UPI003531F663